MSLRRQLEALQTISFLSAAGKVVPFHRRKSTGNPAGRKYTWEMAHGSFQWASPTHNVEMIRSKRWTRLLPQAAPSMAPGLPFAWVRMSSSGSLPCLALPAPSLSDLGGKSNLITLVALCSAPGPLLCMWPSPATQKNHQPGGAKEKKLGPKLGLHVTPMRDFCPPMLRLSSSSMLASETFDPQTFQLLKQEMDQQQGSWFCLGKIDKLALAAEKATSGQFFWEPCHEQWMIFGFTSPLP